MVKLAATRFLSDTLLLGLELLGPVAALAEAALAVAGRFPGTPGLRIGGGTDEVQKNIIGERILGLPSEPRPDRDLPFAATT